MGIREGKSFRCPSCGHVDHADANASFNIALRPPSVGGIGQLHADRDACKGSTDTPRGATPRTTETPEPPSFSEENMSVGGLGMGGPQDLKTASLEIAAIIMDGVSVTKPRLKRGSVRYASAPSTAPAGNTDSTPISVHPGPGRPVVPVELRTLPAVGGQGGALRREAPSVGRGSSLVAS